MKSIVSSIFCLVALNCFAQSDSTKKTTLTLAAVYSTNANYYGQTAQEKMPYAATSATLRFPSGIYFSGMAYKLLNSPETSAVSATSLGLGYGFNMGEKWTADLSYNHTFFPSNSTFLQASNPNTASASLSVDHLFTTGLGADYNFGKQDGDIFLTLSNSKYVKLGNISSKDIISITPAIDIIAGTRRFYKSYLEKRKTLGFPDPIFPVEPAPTGSHKEVTQMDIISYNFRLPLAYNRANYMIEASYQLSVLGPNIESTDKGPKSFLNFSFYYQF